MLTENIMHECVVKLLQRNNEESYECLCKLLFTIGKDLDQEKAKVSNFSEVIFSSLFYLLYSIYFIHLFIFIFQFLHSFR